jgi:hypothetical protein
MLSTRNLHSSVGIPPTVVGGLFKSLLREDLNGFAQKLQNPTHVSGWIGSGPFYKNIPERYVNPTHGSGWMLQILS